MSWHEHLTKNSPNPVYTFGPVEEHLNIPGVGSATRVGRYKFSAIVPAGSLQGTFLGIDRLTFPPQHTGKEILLLNSWVF